jgi:hypothetical protein
MNRIHRVCGARIPSALAWVVFVLLAFGVDRAALASMAKVPGSGGPGVVPLHHGTIRIVTVTGIAGWQVALIALAAAVLAAGTAVAADRALAARRRIPTTAT